MWGVGEKYDPQQLDFEYKIYYPFRGQLIQLKIFGLKIFLSQYRQD